MTPVIFHIVTPKGEPVANAKIKINLSRAAFNEDDAVTIMPRPITVVTDAQGSVTVPLVPCTRLYIMTVEDGPTCGYMQFRFFVPELASGETAVNFEKIIVDFPVSNKNYDEEALLLIHQTKNDVLDALASTVENLNETVLAKNAAQTAAGDAMRDADDAEAAVIAAQNALSAAMLVQGNDYDAKSKKIVNVANATQPSDAVNLGLLDSRTATLNQAINAAQTQADKGVNDAAGAKARADQGVADAGIAYQNAVNARAVADAAYPKAGNAVVTGYFGATVIDHIGTGGGQPRVRLSSTGGGEPAVALSRWSGFGENDSTWRFINNNGSLQIEFDNVNRLGSQVNFASAMRLTMQEVTVLPDLRVGSNIIVGDDDPINYIRKTALLAWDGVDPVASENKEVMRLRVLGIPGSVHNGSFRFYTSGGNNGPFSPGHILSIFGWDAGQGQAAKPALQLSGVGDLVVKSIVGAQFPLSTVNTLTGSGWMKIAKINTSLQGGDVVIRVSGTTSCDAKPTSSSGSLTTIIARVDNDGQLRGSFHTEVPHAYGSPPEVIFGLDGTVYMLVGNYYQISVYIDCHSSLYTEQPVVYHSATLEPPIGNYAVKQWGLRIGNTGQSLHVTETDITSTCNIRAQYLIPNADNTYDIGLPSQSYRTIYARTGTINTSDARLKQDFRELTDIEIAAARDIGRAIKAYRWKEAVELKEEDAREHIGPTVQQAITIMENYGLDPFNYGFICHDVWEAEVIEHPAKVGSPEVLPTEEVQAVIDKDGNTVVEYQPATTGYPAFPAVEARTEVVREAGDRYAFRYDELNMFINAATVAYQDKLEQRLLALEAAQ